METLQAVIKFVLTVLAEIPTNVTVPVPIWEPIVNVLIYAEPAPIKLVLRLVT